MTPKELRVIAARLKGDSVFPKWDTLRLLQEVRRVRRWLLFLRRTAGKRELGLFNSLDAALAGAPPPQSLPLKRWKGTEKTCGTCAHDGSPRCGACGSDFEDWTKRRGR